MCVEQRLLIQPIRDLLCRAQSSAAMTVLLVGLMSLGFFAPVTAHAFQIDGVHVSPPDPIHPGDPVSLEITIRTPTSPAFLTQPTDVEGLGNSIFVDVYASAGQQRAIDELTEVVDLGRFSPGTYTYTVTLIPEFDSNFGREMRVATGDFTILRRSAKPRCGDFQLMSCVGDEVQSCSATTPYGERYAVTAADVANSRSSGNAQLCFAVLSSSLCPDTDAIATIAKNGRVIYSGSIFDINGFLRVNAKEAELIDISVILQPIPRPDISCVLLGDTFFGLGRIQ